MPSFTPSEQTMWVQLPPESPTQLNDDQINEKYGKRELRIVTETNREQLPNFVEALNRPGWMELRPFYQRRPRWEAKRQSKLIESFIMNVPVPPLFVYESDLAKYEVMDGQQRITAIKEFYSNKLRLEGLEQWPELNGRRYDDLPSEIKKGIDRRSISYIVLLKESATTSDEEALLRQQVFERLNTGGIELTKQEIRHCIYHGPFDQLLLELSKHELLRKAWDLPQHTKDEDAKPPKALLDKKHFSQMKDVEVVLRFFALRHVEHYRRGMQGFLDLYMVRSRRFTDSDISTLRDIFCRTIIICHDIYGEHLFKPWVPLQHQWAAAPQIAFADAVLVGFSEHLERADKLRAAKDEIVAKTKELFASHAAGTFTGQKNTKQDLKDRLRLFNEMLDAF
ncbi:DUF262 domain-containing protein [Planctomyces sp. SH-PL14]|uniref:DUF262 domain-containing protein n=1 Tax=Planctomyces sp. SH-PL14 TaxID=1632864 RepID=UPI00078D3B76|nr:DUF262 domain-containing protein [Planctomyces sp. SH-PL14]AMV17859.1 hypothetical protein VT03_08195 [Planctomyces sp. SH-PL14]